MVVTALKFRLSIIMALLPVGRSRHPWRSAALLLSVAIACCLLPLSALAGPLPPEMTSGGVLFQFEDPVAGRVNLAGEMNQWNDRSLPMSREGDKFVLVLPLAEGKYKYKYVIDGQWMNGDDLVLTIIRKDGRLYIYPREPYLRFPFTSKVSMDGYYLFISSLSDDVDGPGGKIRSQTPRNDLDLNFDIHPTDILRAWAQLNVNTMNNDDKVNMDEAFLDLKLGDHFMLKPFETHWNIEFDDPFRLLDQEVQQFDNGVYLTDDDRPFYFQYGRYARGFSGDFDLWKWKGQFFFSNRVKLDQGSLDNDLWGMRLKHPGRKVTWGFTLTQSRSPNGINADAGGDVGTKHPTTDMNGGAATVQYPDGGGSYYRIDTLRQINAGGQNGISQAGLDFSVKFGGWMLMSEILARRSDAAALAYSSGNRREIYGQAYGQGTDSSAGVERVFGEQSNGLSLLMGAIYRNRAWANEFNVRLHNYKAKSFLFASATDTSVGDISPDWMEVIHRLQLNRRMDDSWKFEMESRFVNRSALSKGNIFYTDRIDAYTYLFTDVPWAKQTIEERMKLKLRFGESVWFHTYYDWRSLNRFGKDLGRTDIHTEEGIPRLEWAMSEKWRMDLGARYKSLNFGTIGGVDYDARFVKPFLGFKYEWSKLFHVRFWWGLDPYVDEDKKIGLEWRLQDLFRPAAETVVDRGQDTGSGASLANIVTETERRFDQETIFALQAELRF